MWEEANRGWLLRRLRDNGGGRVAQVVITSKSVLRRFDNSMPDAFGIVGLALLYETELSDVDE